MSEPQPFAFSCCRKSHVLSERDLGMRKILFSLVAALMTITASAKEGPPTVTIQYDLGLLVIERELAPRAAGQLFAECKSKGEIEFLGLRVPCGDLAMDAGPGGDRVIRLYVDFF